MGNNGYPVAQLVDRLANTATREGAWEEFHQQFQEFISRQACAAFRTCLTYCPDRELADFVQDVYLHLFANGGRVLLDFRGDTEETFRGYLAVICYNLARNHCKKSLGNRYRGRSEDAEPALPSQQERAVLRRELRALIEKILHRICRSERAWQAGLVFKLRYISAATPAKTWPKP